MKFHEAEHEVHHNSQTSNSSWHTTTGTTSGIEANRQSGGGPFGFDLGGQSVQSGALGYNFNSGEVTHPLRDTVTRLGWGWKAALFKL